MGTNYYFKDGKHIGKKSAAGYYCWDCGLTLCKKGKEGIHYNTDWYDKCPKCGKEIERESLDDSASGRELGFNRQPYKKKTGVKSCSSFTWAIEPDLINKLNSFGKPIRDEYGDTFTKRQFLKILEECPVQYFGMVGKEFS